MDIRKAITSQYQSPDHEHTLLCNTSWLYWDECPF